MNLLKSGGEIITDRHLFKTQNHSDMRFAEIKKYDVANGPGIRTSIFFSGCKHACEGCFNEMYQNFNYGRIWTDDHTNQIISNLKETEIKGLTILGGEPLQQPFSKIFPMIEKIKKNMPDGKTIWIYSGYRWDEILKNDNLRRIVQFADVLIDGRFELSLKNLKLKFRGSSNQRILDVKKSFVSGELVLFKDSL